MARRSFIQKGRTAIHADEMWRACKNGRACVEKRRGVGSVVYCNSIDVDVVDPVVLCKYTIILLYSKFVVEDPLAADPTVSGGELDLGPPMGFCLPP